MSHDYLQTTTSNGSLPQAPYEEREPLLINSLPQFRSNAPPGWTGSRDRAECERILRRRSLHCDYPPHKLACSPSSSSSSPTRRTFRLSTTALRSFPFRYLATNRNSLLLPQSPAERVSSGARNAASRRWRTPRFSLSAHAVRPALRQRLYEPTPLSLYSSTKTALRHRPYRQCSPYSPFCRSRQPAFAESRFNFRSTPPDEKGVDWEGEC